MITELAKFTEQLAPEFAGIGLKPKEGLNILLKPQLEEDGSYSIAEDFEWGIYSKKTKEIDPLLKKCAQLTHSTWMISTNKCLDSDKGIHSCSPFSLAFKRNALEGGKTFREIEKKKKLQLHQRLKQYFDATIHLTEKFLDTEGLNLAKTLANHLSTKAKIDYWLDKVSAFDKLKDNEYIVFLLDIPIEHYNNAHKAYLQGRLFNSKPQVIAGEQWGVHSFFNGLNVKKPFLTHRTASFEASGQISLSMAESLHQFKDLLSRRVLPKPLPIFIYKEELWKLSFEIFKKHSLYSDDEAKKSIAKVYEDLYSKQADDLSNYYLIYTVNSKDGVTISDFDFVGKFNYKLLDKSNRPWKVEKTLLQGKSEVLNNVFDFQEKIVTEIFNNSLVVKGSYGSISVLYFEKIEQKKCDNNNALIYNLILKYRKVFYDFIFKSRKAAISPVVWMDVLRTSIIADFKNASSYSELRICTKLNILFSLNHHFDPLQTNFNGLDMNRTIPLLMEKMRAVANENAHFESPEEFAFGAGQVIYFLLTKSKADKRTHALLEAFTQKTDLNQLKLEITRTFDRYKHEIDFGKGRFENLMREVLGYVGDIDLRKSFPTLLAGYFAQPVIFEKKEKEA